MSSGYIIPTPIYDLSVSIFGRPYVPDKPALPERLLTRFEILQKEAEELLVDPFLLDLMRSIKPVPVFCKNCRHFYEYSDDMGGYTHCDHPICFLKDQSPLKEKKLRVEDTHTLNVDNTCKYFEPNLIFRIKKWWQSRPPIVRKKYVC